MKVEFLVHENSVSTSLMARDAEPSLFSGCRLPGPALRARPAPCLRWPLGPSVARPPQAGGLPPAWGGLRRSGLAGPAKGRRPYAAQTRPLLLFFRPFSG